MKAELIEGRMRQTTRLMRRTISEKRRSRVYCDSECLSNNESTVAGDKTFSRSAWVMTDTGESSTNRWKTSLWIMTPSSPG